jgi:hypothetical protein
VIPGRAGLAATLGWLLLGAYGLWSGIRLGVGQLADPGAGFMPAIAGSLLLAMALALFVRDVRARSRFAVAAEAAADGDPSLGSRLAPVATIVLLGVFAATFERVGFALATFALVAVLAKFVGKLRWVTAAALGIGVAAGCQIIFKMLLKVPLP